MSIPVSAWVNSVEWSPSDLYCFIATQDSILTIVNNSSQKIASMNLFHSPICFFMPSTDYSLFAVGFDRHIYEYVLDGDLAKENPNSTWVCKRNITGGSYPVNKTPQLDYVSKSVIETKSSSIMEVMKKFEGAQKRNSQIITSTNTQNIHAAPISSVNSNSDLIITTDYAGFLKTWKFS